VQTLSCHAYRLASDEALPAEQALLAWGKCAKEHTRRQGQPVRGAERHSPARANADEKRHLLAGEKAEPALTDELAVGYERLDLLWVD